MNSHFDHERLDVYQAALKFVILNNEVIEHFPRSRSHLTDQLQRASRSILLNIAEGAGILAIIQSLRLTRQELQQGDRNLLLRVVSMLSKMVQVTGKVSENASANANVHENICG